MTTLEDNKNSLWRLQRGERKRPLISVEKKSILAAQPSNLYLCAPLSFTYIVALLNVQLPQTVWEEREAVEGNQEQERVINSQQQQREGVSFSTKLFIPLEKPSLHIIPNPSIHQQQIHQSYTFSLSSSKPHCFSSSLPPLLRWIHHLSPTSHNLRTRFTMSSASNRHSMAPPASTSSSQASATTSVQVGEFFLYS